MILKSELHCIMYMRVNNIAGGGKYHQETILFIFSTCGTIYNTYLCGIEYTTDRTKK